ncbi:MAG: hypothetical protein HYX54_07215 [Chloroflexi bacterium]|nr:hypothetical protein [Chloroflexota bacterium]
MDVTVQGQREHIGELCRSYAVRRLSLFGSAVRDDIVEACKLLPAFTSSKSATEYAAEPESAR